MLWQHISMFYRKYRPQKFSEVSKPNETAEALMNQIAKDKVGHAYLFYGPRGTGKTTVARILSKALNCQKLGDNGDPCGRCEVCKAVQNGNFYDLIEIDAASNRGIDDIRELKDRIKLAPSSGKKKIYIIDEVHMLTNEAFNALLKTLEEPPTHTVFILATTEFHKVPETIKSRCQVFKFKRATVAQIVERLEKITKAEDAKIAKDDLRKIAESSLGGFRDADTLLQQVIEGNLSIDSLLNVGSVQNYIDFVNLLLLGDSRAALKQVNKVFEEGVDLYLWTGELIKYLRDLLFVKADADEDLVDLTENVIKSLKRQAEALETVKVVSYIDAFIKAQNNIKNSFVTQLPVELAIIEVTGRDGSKMEGKSKVAVSVDVADERINDKKTTKPNKISVQDTQSAAGSTIAVMGLEEVQNRWSEVLDRLADQNSSVQALLKASSPVSIEGSTLVLEVFYAFHKERLESPKNRKMVETVFRDVLDADVRLRCQVSENRPPRSSEKEVGELTDYNVVLPPVTEGSALDIFDGGLPLR